MTILSIRPSLLKQRPLGSRKRHYERAVCAARDTNSGMETESSIQAMAAPVTPEEAVMVSDVIERRGKKDSIALVIPILLFGSMYVYGMLDQAPSSVLSTFEYYLFVALVPALLVATSAINVYALLKSRRRKPVLSKVDDAC